MEEVAKTQVGEGRGIAGNRGGVFIDTSTPATTEIELVTNPERAGSTINVGDVGLVITLRLIVTKTGGIMETPSSRQPIQTKRRSVLSITWKGEQSSSPQPL